MHKHFWRGSFKLAFLKNTPFSLKTFCPVKVTVHSLENVFILDFWECWGYWKLFIYAVVCLYLFLLAANGISFLRTVKAFNWTQWNRSTKSNFLLSSWTQMWTLKHILFFLTLYITLYCIVDWKKTLKKTALFLILHTYLLFK